MSVGSRAVLVVVSSLGVLGLLGAVGCSESTGSSGNTSVVVSEMFTDADLVQSPDLAAATAVVLTSGNTVTLSDAGIYLLSGSAEDASVVVDADAADVQLVLDGVTVRNANAAVIQVIAADKVTITTTDSTNILSTTGAFTDTSLPAAVIASREDLVLNGTGTLEIASSENGVSSNDDLKVTGGTLRVVAELDGLEAHNSVRIGGGDITIDSGKDAVHAEDADDDTVGFVYVAAGALQATAADDGIRATTLVQIDGGSVDVDAAEGIEATFILINDGNVTVNASNDGINAAAKSAAYNVAIEVNGGTIAVTVGAGDTDAFDANGDIFINGGTIDIVTPQSGFDADGVAELNGGTVTVNGSVITAITQTGPGAGVR
jgi:hypothetical protein